jgi:hypothetical protein
MFLNPLGQVIVHGDNESYAFGIGQREEVEGYEIIPNLPEIKTLYYANHELMHDYENMYPCPVFSALIDINDNLLVCGDNSNNKLGIVGVGTVYHFTKVYENVARCAISMNFKHSLYFITLGGDLINCAKIDSKIASNIVDIKSMFDKIYILDDCGNVSIINNRMVIIPIPELSGISKLSELTKKSSIYTKSARN